MSKNDEVKTLLEKVEAATKEKKLDLSSDEDLSVGIMNLIAIEEHLFFTLEKTGKEKYLDLLNEVRLMRTELMKNIIKDYEGEVWCISKHLLSASMRLIEVGTKELKKGEKGKATELFDKAFKLYSLFWGINLGVVVTQDVKRNTKDEEKILLTNDPTTNNPQPTTKSASVFDKLGSIVQKALDCCKE